MTLTLLYVLQCVAICARLIFYRREGARHRPLVALGAYAVILATAVVPIRAIFGELPAVDFTDLVVTGAFAAAVWRCRGNLCDVFRPPTWAGW